MVTFYRAYDTGNRRCVLRWSQAMQHSQLLEPVEHHLRMSFNAHHDACLSSWMSNKFVFIPFAHNTSWNILGPLTDACHGSMSGDALTGDCLSMCQVSQRATGPHTQYLPPLREPAKDIVPGNVRACAIALTDPARQGLPLRRAWLQVLRSDRKPMP
jgi:hypothetical protein